jgi:hypothetical protein
MFSSFFTKNFLKFEADGKVGGLLEEPMDIPRWRAGWRTDDVRAGFNSKLRYFGKKSL